MQQRSGRCATDATRGELRDPLTGLDRAQPMAAGEPTRVRQALATPREVTACKQRAVLPFEGASLDRDVETAEFPQLRESLTRLVELMRCLAAATPPCSLTIWMKRDAL